MTDADIVRAALVSARERAQKAEDERDRLRESLRGLVTAVDHYRDFEPEWNPEYEWSQESTDAWKRIEEILDANVDAARETLEAHTREMHLCSKCGMPEVCEDCDDEGGHQ